MADNKNSKTDHHNGRIDPAKKIVATDLAAKYGSEKAKFIKTADKADRKSDEHQITDKP